MYEEYLNVIDSIKEELYQLSDEIWECPEIAFREKKSVQILTAYLGKKGFTVECPVYGIETAFVAAYGAGRPYIGILGEFDALAGLSQKSGIAKKESLIEGGNGHGCGHNLLGVGSLAAAMIVKDYLQKTGNSGTVFYYGCPAEEGGSGKAFMAREGAFSELDAAFCWHPAELNEVMQESSLANVQVRYRFDGLSAHAAENPEDGRSALDALELMNVGVNFLREHMSSQARIHYAVTDAGGVSANVVQAHAEAVYLIRDTDMQKTYRLWNRVNRIAEGMAEAMEVKVEWQLIKSCSNLISNRVLEHCLYQGFLDTKPPVYSEEELQLAKAFADTTRGVMETRLQKRMETMIYPQSRSILEQHLGEDIFTGIVPYEERAAQGLLSGSTDVGDVSWQCPTAQIRTATWAAGSGGHSWQIVAQGKGGQAHKGMLYAGKVMGHAVLQLLEKPELLRQAKAEFDAFRKDREYIPIPKEIHPVPLGK